MPRYPAWVLRLYRGAASGPVTVEERCLLQHFFDSPSSRFVPSRRGTGVNFAKSAARCGQCSYRSFEPGVDDYANYRCWCSLPDRLQPRQFTARLKKIAEKFEEVNRP